LRIIVFVDTVLLAILCLLMVGLLRGHAELLRRTSSTGEPSNDRPANASAGSNGARGSSGVPLPEPRVVETPAADISGATVDGGASKISMRSDRNTLLAFLSSGCSACVPLWEGLSAAERAGVPGDARIVVVTKDPSQELKARLRDLVPAGSTVVMSSQAYADYQVELSPYFIYVDGLMGEVRSEGAATAWPQVFSLLSEAIAEYAAAGSR
jgi:hypothetical protein